MLADSFAFLRTKMRLNACQVYSFIIVIFKTEKSSETVVRRSFAGLRNF